MTVTLHKVVTEHDKYTVEVDDNSELGSQVHIYDSPNAKRPLFSMDYEIFLVLVQKCHKAMHY